MHTHGGLSVLLCLLDYVSIIGFFGHEFIRGYILILSPLVVNDI